MRLCHRVFPCLHPPCHKLCRKIDNLQEYHRCTLSQPCPPTTIAQCVTVDRRIASVLRKNRPTVYPSDDFARMLSYQELLTSIQVWQGHGQEATRGEAGGPRITRHVKRLGHCSSRVWPLVCPCSRCGAWAVPRPRGSPGRPPGPSHLGATRRPHPPLP